MRSEKQAGDPKPYAVIAYSAFGEIPPHHIDGIVACGIAAFGAGMTREEVVDHIKHGRVTVITKNRQVVGFAVSYADTLTNRFGLNTALADQAGVYLAGVAITPAEQARGLYNPLNEGWMREAIRNRVPYLFLRTQNPRVELGIRTLLSSFQKEGVILDYSVERIQQPGAYGRKLAELKEYYPELNSEAGDAYILIFRLNYGS